MKIKQLKKIITEEEILAGLSKAEDRELMNGLKKIKFIEDLESIFRKLPFLRKLVSSKDDEKQLSKELLNRINYVRKADDFKYRIDEKDIKTPYKKMIGAIKEKIDDLDLELEKRKKWDVRVGDRVYFNNDPKKIYIITKVKEFDGIEPSIHYIDKENIDRYEGSPYFKKNMKILKPSDRKQLKPDTSENLLKKYKEDKDREIENELKQATNRISEYKLFESLVKQFALLYGKNNNLIITLQDIVFNEVKPIFYLTIKKIKTPKPKQSVYTFSELDQSLNEGEEINELARHFVLKAIEKFKEKYDN